MKDLTAQRFGRLQVLWSCGRNKWGSYLWTCQCDCSKICVVCSGDLIKNHTTSCGCYVREKNAELRRLEHARGESRRGKGNNWVTPERAAWRNARKRCWDANNAGYKNYGGRGIKFLFLSYEEFLSHLGPRPSADYSLDRIDNNGHYELGNVRWATGKEQIANRRKRSCHANHQ